MGLLAQCDIARKPENKSKNRYGNIVACKIDEEYLGKYKFLVLDIVLY